MSKKLAGSEGLLAEIRREMAGLGPVLFGDLSAKTQKYVKADRTVTRQKAQSIFRFAKRGGKMTRRVPSDTEPAVRRMIADGKRFSALRDEYERTLTALALDGALTKTPFVEPTRTPLACLAAAEGLAGLARKHGPDRGADPVHRGEDIETSAHLTELVLLGNVALPVGKKILWDPSAMRAVKPFSVPRSAYRSA